MLRTKLLVYNSRLEYLQPKLLQRDYFVVLVGLVGKLNFMYKLFEGKKIRLYILGFTSYIHSLNWELDNFEYGSSSTFNLNVGTGVEIEFKIVTFAPEFRYFHGLTNVN